MIRINSKIVVKPEEFTRFIAAYRSRPRLWKRSMHEYSHNGPKRAMIYKEMIAELAIPNVKTVAELQSMLKYLRATYRSALVNKFEKNRQPKWIYFNMVDEFLNEFTSIGKKEYHFDESFSVEIAQGMSEESVAVANLEQSISNEPSSSGATYVSNNSVYFSCDSDNFDHSSEVSAHFGQRELSQNLHQLQEVNSQLELEDERTFNFLKYIRSVIDTMPEAHANQLKNYMISFLAYSYPNQ